MAAKKKKADAKKKTEKKTTLADAYDEDKEEGLAPDPVGDVGEEGPPGDADAEEPKAEEKPKPRPKAEEPRVEPKVKGDPKGDWYDKLVAKAADQSKTLPAKLQGPVDDGLAFLVDYKDDLLDLGEDAFGQVVDLLGSGKKNEARVVFIKTKLGPEGLIAEMKRSTKAMLKATEKRASFDAKFNAMVTAASTFAFNVLKTLLFSELGIA